MESYIESGTTELVFMLLFVWLIPAAIFFTLLFFVVKAAVRAALKEHFPQ